MLCNLFAKGPSFSLFNKQNESDLHVCVNQTAIFVPQIDVIVINDVEVLLEILKAKGITNERIFMPYYPHVNCRPGVCITEYTFYHKYKDNITSFNLPTVSEKNEDLFSTQTAISSTHTAIEIVLEFYKEVDCICTYGFSNGKGYHRMFAEWSWRGKRVGKRAGDKKKSIEKYIPDNVKLQIY